MSPAARLALVAVAALALGGCDQLTKHCAVSELSAESTGAGHVVDFIHWHVRDVLDYPTFNVADVWIFLGGLLLLVATFRPAPAAT